MLRVPLEVVGDTLHGGLSGEAEPSGTSADAISWAGGVETRLADGGHGIGGGGRDVFEECSRDAVGPVVHGRTVELLPLGSHGLFLGGGVEVALACDTTVLTHIVCEERSESLLDSVLAADLNTALERDPGALVFSVPALDLLMDACLDFLLQYLCALALVEAGDFEDLCRIQMAVVAAAHDRHFVGLHLVHLHAAVGGGVDLGRLDVFDMVGRLGV